MKNYLKFLPVVAGLALATFGSINEAEASVEEENAFFGHCVGRGHCGTTAQGTCLKGKWHENNGDEINIQ